MLFLRCSVHWVHLCLLLVINFLLHKAANASAISHKISLMVSGQASCSALVHVSSTTAHLKGPRKHTWLHVQFPVSLFIRPCVVFHSVAFRQGVYAHFPSNASWLEPAVIKSSWTLLVGAGLGAVEYEMPLCVCRFWSGLKRREDWAYSIFTVFTQTPAASYCILPATRTFWGTQKSWWVNGEKKSHTTGTLIIHRAFWAEEILPFVAVFIFLCIWIVSRLMWS